MQALSVSSPAFQHHTSIPEPYSCEGESISPPISWSGVPEETQSVAVVVDDPDAPGGTFVHWVVYNLPANVSELPEGAKALPGDAEEGKNSAKKAGYYPMCPPSGRHRYYFKVYALDTKLDGLRQPSVNELERAMRGHVLAQGELMGTYEKHLH